MKQSHPLQPLNDWQNNACINFSSDQHHTYSLAYKEAADFLSSNAVEMSAQDLFIYPIVFLYRHHLELQLKLIIKNGELILHKENKKISGHDLKKLWDTAKNIIIKIYPHGDTNFLSPIDKAIDLYHGIDPGSTTFRYSLDHNGNKNLSGISHISISSLYKIVNDAASILDNIYDGFIEINENVIEAMNN